jgi:hypothetical protein
MREFRRGKDKPKTDPLGTLQWERSEFERALPIPDLKIRLQARFGEVQEAAVKFAALGPLPVRACLASPACAAYLSAMVCSRLPFRHESDAF